MGGIGLHKESKRGKKGDRPKKRRRGERAREKAKKSGEIGLESERGRVKGGKVGLGRENPITWSLVSPFRLPFRPFPPSSAWENVGGEEGATPRETRRKGRKRERARKRKKEGEIREKPRLVRPAFGHEPAHPLAPATPTSLSPTFRREFRLTLSPTQPLRLRSTQAKGWDSPVL